MHLWWHFVLILQVYIKILSRLVSNLFYNWEDGAFKLQAVHPYDQAKRTGNGKTPGSQ